MDSFENKLSEEEARRLQESIDRQREAVVGDGEPFRGLAGPVPEAEKRIEAEVNRPIDMKAGMELAERRQHDADLREQRLVLEESKRAERVADRLSEVDGLKQDQWAAMDATERTWTLRHAGDAIAKEHASPNPTLFVEELPDGESGHYDPATGEMRIDTALVESDDPRDALKTYLHEFRHSYQNETDLAYEKNMITVAPTEKAAEWTANEREGYRVPPEVSFETYAGQPMEADSRSFADDVIRKLYG